MSTFEYNGQPFNMFSAQDRAKLYERLAWDLYRLKVKIRWEKNGDIAKERGKPVHGRISWDDGFRIDLHPHLSRWDEVDTFAHELGHFRAGHVKDFAEKVTPDQEEAREKEAELLKEEILVRLRKLGLSRSG